MEDQEIIEKVAKLWIELGGDTVGFLYCREEIKQKISDLLEEGREDSHEVSI